MKLSERALERYSRQMLLSKIGRRGQRKLAGAFAVIVGVGALGNAVANNLARSGVGKIRLIDRDLVELHNIHRQTLFDEHDVGRPKADCAAERLRRINSTIALEGVLKDFNFSNAESLIAGADVVIDGTDNMETRFLINDACVKNAIPWIYGGAISTYGMTATIIPKKTACLRCFTDIQKAGALPTCDNTGILGAVPMVIGTIESVEAMKIMLGAKGINTELLIYDLWTHDKHSVKIERNKSCKCCAKNDYEFLNVKKRGIVTVLCGRDAVQITPISRGEISLGQLSKKLGKVGKVKTSEFALTFKTQNYELTIFRDARAVIKGTNDEKTAKSLYAKYIGT